MPKAITDHNISMNARALEIVPKSLDEKVRSVEAVIASETPVQRWFRGDTVDEILTVQGCELPDKAPLLDSHSWWSTSSVLGSVSDFSRGEMISALLRFSSVSEDEYTKVREGFLDSVSVGYDILSYYYVETGESVELYGRTYEAKERPMLIAATWKIREVSLVPLPADEQCKIRCKESANQHTPATPGGNRMPNENKNTQTTENTPSGENSQTRTEPQKPATSGSPATPPAVDEGQVRSDAVAAERTRISEIRASCRTLGLTDEFADDLIDNGVELDDARQQMIAEAGKRHKPFTESTGSVRVQTDGGDNIRTGLLLVGKRAFGVRLNDKESTDLRQTSYAGVRGPVGIARAILEEKGVRTAFMSNEEIYQNLRMHGMDDFTYVTSGSGTAAMIAAFEEFAPTCRVFTDETDLADFNTHDLFSLTPLSVFPTVADKENLTELSLDEKAESIKLATKGGVVSLSRQAFISDSFGAFKNVVVLLGEAAARTEEKAVYGLLEDNGNLKDGAALFSGSNLATGATLSIDTVAAAVIAMMGQKVNTEEVGAPPKYLIAPSALHKEAIQITQSITDPSGANSAVVNPYSGVYKLQPVITPFLADTKAYYFAGSKSKTITRAYLNGKTMPEIETFEARGTEALGITFRAIFDLAIGVRSRYYLYKNPGPA